MESGNSSNSLLSGRSSEHEGPYGVESGFYISSFAATIMMAALASIGVVFLFLLVALTVMLKSCQTRSSTFYEQIGTSNQYAYCKFASFHAELNGLAKDELPTVCKQLGFWYVNKGYFIRDLDLTLQLAKDYFRTVKPGDDGSYAILVDIDDIFLAEVIGYNASLLHQTKEHKDMTHLAGEMVFRFLLELQTSGWSIHFFSRNPSCNSKPIAEVLRAAGFKEWSSLITRSDNELLLENWEYIAATRLKLHNQGFRIASVISSRMDAFRGSYIGERNFKLASPMLQHSAEQMNSCSKQL